MLPVSRQQGGVHRHRAQRERVPSRGDFYEGKSYTLRVHKQFRGTRARTIRVFTANDSAREVLEVGKTYIVFARKGNAKHPLQIFCRDTQDVTDIEDAATMMQAVRRQKGSVIILGRVVDGAWSAAPPLADVTVKVHGPGGLLILKTGKDGQFRAKVPPGRYRVSARGPDGRRMLQTDYNGFEVDAEHFATEPGECVDLVFEPAPGAGR